MKAKYIYGHHAIEEALNSGTSVEKIFIQKDLKSDLYPLANDHGVPVSKVPRVWFKKFANSNHQGHIALVSPIEFVDAEEEVNMLFSSGKNPLILALDGVSDVRNFGAILRSAEAFGVDLVLIPAKGSAAINADTVKTSAGSIFNIKVARAASLRNTLKALKMSGLQITSASEKADKSHHDIDWTLPSVLVMGSEEKGVSDEVLKLGDACAIQMLGKTSSLNVSVATGVILSQILHKRA